MKFGVNTAALRQKWFKDCIIYAKRHLEKASAPPGAIPGPDSKALVFSSFDEDSAYDFQAKGAFALPPGSGPFVLRMARFAQSRLLQPDALLGFDEYLRDQEIGPSGSFPSVDMEENGFPDATFCLPSLLRAAFPCDPSEDRCKNTTGGIVIGMFDDRDLRPEDVDHAVFAGIGVILMTQAGRILDPLATDETIITKARNHYVSIF